MKTLRVPHGRQIFTRTTARTYTHLVVVRAPGPGVRMDPDVWKDVPGAWHAYAWCGRPDLAAKKEREALKRFQEVKILEVPQTPPATKETV